SSWAVASSRSFRPSARILGYSRNFRNLRQAKDLVELERQSPARVARDEIQRAPEVPLVLGVHARLQEKLTKIHGFVARERVVTDGVVDYQLALVAALQDELEATLVELRLRAHGEPVDGRGQRARAVRLHVDPEAGAPERFGERRVPLQRRLA